MTPTDSKSTLQKFAFKQTTRDRIIKHINTMSWEQKNKLDYLLSGFYLAALEARKAEIVETIKFNSEMHEKMYKQTGFPVDHSTAYAKAQKDLDQHPELASKLLIEHTENWLEQLFGSYK